MNLRPEYKTLRTFFYSVIVGSLLLFESVPVFAQDALKEAAKEAYGNNPKGADKIGLIVGNAINAVISVTGVIMILLVVYAGILYLTAMGDAKKVEKAKSLLSSAVIGLVIILAAYSITTFVVTQLQNVTK